MYAVHDEKAKYGTKFNGVDFIQYSITINHRQQYFRHI